MFGNSSRADDNWIDVEDISGTHGNMWCRNKAHDCLRYYVQGCNHIRKELLDIIDRQDINLEHFRTTSMEV